MAALLAEHLRSQAHANRLANLRLHTAMAALSPAEFHAPRTSFFPSLAETLNHILKVDLYYIAALHHEMDMVPRAEAFEPHADLASLAAAQAGSDERLIAFCARLDDAAASAEVTLDRGDHLEINSAAQTLAHLFMHQTHHRGQVHAMLSGSTVAPPQLDEFLLASDARYRVAELQRLGWTEAQLFPPAS